MQLRIAADFADFWSGNQEGRTLVRRASAHSQISNDQSAWI